MEERGTASTVTEERLLTVPEAARRLGMGKSWAWQRVLDGELPSVKLSQGARRIRPVDLERFIAARLTEPRPEPLKSASPASRAQGSRGDDVDGHGSRAT
jgi:excisionase family DNA binding protein